MENGPVVRSLYDEFKKHKGNAIKGYHAEADGTIYLINEDSSSYLKKQSMKYGISIKNMMVFRYLR